MERIDFGFQKKQGLLCEDLYDTLGSIFFFNQRFSGHLCFSDYEEYFLVLLLFTT